MTDRPAPRDNGAEVPTADISGPGFTLRVLAPFGQWLVSGEDAATNSVTGLDPYAIWLGPGRRLVVAMQPAPAPQAPYITDVSADMVLMELDGPGWPDLLAMASAVDPALLAPGRCTQTLFAGTQTLLYRHEAALRLHVEQPAAARLRDWIRRAARMLTQNNS